MITFIMYSPTVRGMVDKTALKERVKEESEKIFPELKKLKDGAGL